MTRVDRLLEIMARLRDPEDGCPWDVEQTFETIAPYTLEEAYEVDHAIARGDMTELCDELGDLLLQVVFHAQMADEAGHFAFDDVVTAICDKLVRRHPHVFRSDDGEEGEQGPVVRRTANDQLESWEEIKADERAARANARGEGDTASDLFEGIPIALPALSRASKLRKRALKPGSEPRGIDPRGALRKQVEDTLAKIEDRVGWESRDAQDATDAAARQSEMGRLLALCVDLSRVLGVDPELALREANRTYEDEALANVANDSSRKDETG